MTNLPEEDTVLDYPSASALGRKIQTRFGWIDVFDPKHDDVDIRDIAHGLAHKCRFGGFTPQFYSVAEHCMNVRRLVEAWGGTQQQQKAALLHDAQEAYLCDMPSPIKSGFPDYQRVEDHLQLVIFDSFELPWPTDWMVQHADRVVLHFEAETLMGEPARVWINPHHVAEFRKKCGWLRHEPQYAASRFVAEFDRLD